MKIGLILGTRPEIIKLSPVIRGLIKKQIDFEIIHTGQHYSEDMDRIFFEELDLPVPNVNLEAGSGSQATQISRILARLEEYLIKNPVDIALVQGDTNTVMAGALISSRLGIKVGHVEAGLRSYDRTMPEEINRIITDHVSDFLFPPTETAMEILRKEGIEGSKMIVTGNTVVDAVHQNLKIAKKKVNTLTKLGLKEQGFVFVTAHRPANVDNKENLNKLFNLLKEVNLRYKIPIVYPVHPRTKKNIEKFQIPIPKEVQTVSPLGYLEFLDLLSKAKMVLTDSGGIQEEACVLKVPCITLRENTERPETLDVGSNRLCGLDKERVKKAIEYFKNNNCEWKNPFGDGTAAKKIIEFICNKSTI